jgi:hypothetical protein
VDENGWVDMSNEDAQKWISEFFDRFVTKIDSNEKVSIYECTTNDDEE